MLKSALLVLALQFSVALLQAQSVALKQTIPVPLDYSDPHSATAPLTLELGARFDAKKSTLILVADGQQFFIRPGAAAQLQQKIFGPDFNVVGLITRGTTPEFINATLDADSKPNWVRAWKVFNSGQWIEDIDSVRRHLLGPDGKIMLYGRSGGAYLVHQYLAKYGEHVTRAFTQSAVNPSIVHDLGLPIDTFWSELGQQDPELQRQLLAALSKMPAERQQILLALQRQHFYVPADQLNTERAKLIRSLFAGDMSVYDDDKKKYEVDSVMQLENSNDSIPQDVRVLELIYPTGAFNNSHAEPVRPLIDTQQEFIRPLLDLVAKYQIPAPAFDESPVHRSNTEVFVLAARFDEAVDYRTSIALAYMYPQHFLFVANDNHTFQKMEQQNASSKLIQEFFAAGLNGNAFSQAVREAEPLRSNLTPTSAPAN